MPDLYYQPTQIILANPVLGSKYYEIGKDVVWAKNDSCNMGISQLISRYSHLLASNDISINIAQVTTRMPFVLTAETEAEKLSAEKYVEAVEDGKISVVKTSSFNNGITPQPATTDNAGNTIKALIELHQYLKAQFYNDLGVGSNFNMKRERLTTAEVENNIGGFSIEPPTQYTEMIDNLVMLSDGCPDLIIDGEKVYMLNN